MNKLILKIINEASAPLLANRHNLDTISEILHDVQLFVAENAKNENSSEISVKEITEQLNRACQLTEYVDQAIQVTLDWHNAVLASEDDR